VGDDDDDSAPAQATLIVLNDSGIAVTALRFGPCGETPATEIALSPYGLQQGEDTSWRVDPGCWRIEAEGGGCFASKETEGDLPAGESFQWTIAEIDLLCVGG
jgi:hypothetical protein